MAFAYCPRCHKSFRYKAASRHEPGWLRAAVQAGGRHDRVVLSCVACWVVPTEGDPVVVLERPSEPNALKPGWLGTVIETEPFGLAGRLHVHGLDPRSGRPWCHLLRHHQLQAALLGADATLSLSAQSGARSNRGVSPADRARPESADALPVARHDAQS